METTLDKLLKQRKQITEILDRYGAYDLRVFGSVARKEDTEESDIDFLVRFPGASLVTLYELQIELTKLLGKEVDLGTDVLESLRAHVYSEAIHVAGRTGPSLPELGIGT